MHFEQGAKMIYKITHTNKQSISDAQSIWGFQGQHVWGCSFVLPHFTNTWGKISSNLTHFFIFHMFLHFTSDLVNIMNCTCQKLGQGRSYLVGITCILPRESCLADFSLSLSYQHYSHSGTLNWVLSIFPVWKAKGPVVVQF